MLFFCSYCSSFTQSRSSFTCSGSIIAVHFILPRSRIISFHLLFTFFITAYARPPVLPALWPFLPMCKKQRVIEHPSQSGYGYGQPHNLAPSFYLHLNQRD